MRRGFLLVLGVLLGACSSGGSQSDAGYDAGNACGNDATLTACGAACFDLNSDNQHCGRCDRACEGGTRCKDGACESICNIDGGVFFSGGLNPANACELCAPQTSATAWSILADGTSCAADKHCASGTCQSGCMIDGGFHAEGATNPADRCEQCAIAQSTTAWSTKANGATCGAGTVCETGSCVGKCFINGTFFDASTLRVDGGCEACLPGTSTQAWSGLADGTACGAAQFCTASVCGPDWHGSAPALTPLYGGLSEAGHDGRIYLFGGWPLPGNFSFITQIYDPATGNVTSGRPVPYMTYRGAAVTASSGLIYLMGGQVLPAGNPVATVYSYDIVSDSFTPRSAMPHALSEFSGALGQDGKIYVFGADGAPSIGAPYTAGYTLIYDPVMDKWTTGKPMNILRQDTRAVTLTDGRIMVMSGNTGSIWDKSTGAVEFYTPSTNSWTRGADLPELVYAFAAQLRSDGKVVVAGGVTPDGVTKSTFVYDPVADKWAAGTPTTSGHYYGYDARTPNGRIYVLAGRVPTPSGSNVVTNAVDALY